MQLQKGATMVVTGSSICWGLYFIKKKQQRDKRLLILKTKSKHYERATGSKCG